ncbi:General transcription factor II-I repeat domain-containing protein 2A, partial [Ooceraea biroi]
IEKLVNILQKQNFSILIDESTDISKTKILCVLVQYLSPINETVETKLLELLPLNAVNCSANNLFESFQKLLEKHQIPIQNIVGMASDNASVMIGCNNSFISRLQSEVPGIILLNYICHSFAILPRL